MSYQVELIFGKEQVIKFQQGETLSDYEKLINRKHYQFETLAERNAFYKGLADSNSWTEFQIINEVETKSKEAEQDFDYWGFIVKYYPNYDHSDTILLSDILTRKLHGEEICEEDEEYIKDWDIKQTLMELDKEILGEAFEAFFDFTYPKLINL